MPFILLALLALVYLQDEWPAPPSWLGPLGSIVVTWAGVVLFLVAAHWTVRRAKKSLQRQPQQYAKCLRRYARFRRWHMVAMLVFFVPVIYLAGWGWTVQSCFTIWGVTIPGAELLMLLPLLGSVVFSWARYYDVDLAVRQLDSEELSEKAPGRWAYVGLQASQSLIVAAPPFFLLFSQQILLTLFPALRDSVYVMPAVSAVMLALLFVGYPLIMRVLLNLKPLPTCGLRDRLTAIATRLGFRCTDILLWNTHDSVATALLTGSLPALRYVVLTDKLIRGMTEEEIEAVFAHEIGHIKHRHIPFYSLFFVASLAVFTMAWYLLLERIDANWLQQLLAGLPWPEWWLGNLEMFTVLPLLLALGVHTILVFGHLSRRCERQADLYACRATSFAALISALEKVVWLNGMSRNRPGWLAAWRHGTIAARVNFLIAIEMKRRSEARFQTDTKIIKWAVLAALAAVALLAAPARVWEYLQGMW